MSESCFQLKGSVVTTFILELYQYSRENFTQQLKIKIQQAPEFFHQSPVVISLEKFESDAGDIDFSELVGLCRQFELQPMAFKSVDERFVSAIKSTGLAVLSDAASRATAKDVEIEPGVAVETVVAEKIISSTSKIITRPVRSGQQVYAEGSDLIILAQVSEGAEVLADGNIHIYGNLRGRALAGVKGDAGARVFCKNMEAELISIAGNFMLSDALRKLVWKQAAQVYLDEQTLHVEAV